MSIRQRLRSRLWKVPVEQEVREELDHHIELRTRELVERGWSPEDARKAAQQRLGDPQRFAARLADLGTERDRSFAWREWRDELAQDIRFALRQCRRAPGFTLAAVLTLALGIGLTTAIYSVVYAVVLKPFPFDDPDRVLFVTTTYSQGRGDTSPGNYRYMRERTRTLEHLAAATYSNFNLADAGPPERVIAARTTWNYFPVFGVSPLHGRTYTADEDQPGNAQVVVLSHQLWQRRFGSDPGLVGKDLRLGGQPYTVIGIMPAAWDEFGGTVELYVPIALSAERLANHDGHFLELSGRRRAGVTLAQVNDELARIAEGLQRDHPQFNLDRGAEAELMGDTVVGDYRTRLWVLLGAVALVLVIACGNVANLLLARLAARGRELALRAAIGAGRARIVRQILTESLVLVGFGAVGGLLLAYWAVPVLVAAAPQGVPRLETAGVSAPVLGVALLIIALGTIAVGLLPSWQATSGDMRESLGDSRSAGESQVRPWVRQVLIAGQAALVLVVLAGAALLVRSAINLQQVPIGFDTSGVLTARVSLPAAQYETAGQVRETFRQMLERVQASPGVAMAALDSQPPLIAFGGSNGLVPEGRPFGPESMIISQSHFVSADYFRTLRMPLLAGRHFTDQDIRSGQLVMIVNETLAKSAFDGESPIGKRMICCEGSPEDPKWKVVVGVVADVRARGPAEPPRAEFYLPLAQIPDESWGWIQNSLNILARAEADPAALVGTVRSAVREVDPTLPVYNIRTVDEGLDRLLAQARFNTLLMMLLGLTGLVLAALGVYSVVAWLVALRTREIGVRMALGASSGDVIRQVTGHGLRPVLIGLGIGLAGALATTRLLEGELFEVSARDPLAISAVAVLLVGVATLAAGIPAWRATGIDPAKALHEG